MKGRIVVVTGPPGTGKTTVSNIVAENIIFRQTVNMATDDFYHYLRNGAIPPFEEGADRQNLVVIEAFLEAAKRFARGGYTVIVDGIIGPWFLNPWLKAAEEGYEIYYIVLRAEKEETLKRATGRTKLDRKTNVQLVETMWEQFSGLGQYEQNVLDTTLLTPEGAAEKIADMIDKGQYLLA